MRVERGVLGALPYAAVGEGPPLVLLAGLSPTTGVDGDVLLRSMLGPAAFLPRRAIVFNRRPGMPLGMTMAQIAAEHAAAIRSGFGSVDVMGTSTGGSVAQQLAADHPDVVKRLVLASTACRLDGHGKALQRQVAARIRAGATRQALAVMAGSLVPHGRVLAGTAGFLLGPRRVKDADLADMATTIEAEDAFDLADLAPIRAPTLLIAGRDDRFYAPALFQQTAAMIAGCELLLLDGRGHITVLNDKRTRAALEGFLK
jgi:pimeloyl-ACP methyl ester carboxylesterase